MSDAKIIFEAAEIIAEEITGNNGRIPLFLLSRKLTVEILETRMNHGSKVKVLLQPDKFSAMCDTVNRKICCLDLNELTKVGERVKLHWNKFGLVHDSLKRYIQAKTEGMIGLLVQTDDRLKTSKEVRKINTVDDFNIDIPIIMRIKKGIEIDQTKFEVYTPDEILKSTGYQTFNKAQYQITPKIGLGGYKFIPSSMYRGKPEYRWLEAIEPLVNTYKAQTQYDTKAFVCEFTAYHDDVFGRKYISKFRGRYYSTSDIFTWIRAKYYEGSRIFVIKNNSITGNKCHYVKHIDHKVAVHDVVLNLYNVMDKDKVIGDPETLVIKIQRQVGIMTGPYWHKMVEKVSEPVKGEQLTWVVVVGGKGSWKSTTVKKIIPDGSGILQGVIDSDDHGRMVYHELKKRNPDFMKTREINFDVFDINDQDTFDSYIEDLEDGLVSDESIYNKMVEELVNDRLPQLVAELNKIGSVINVIRAKNVIDEWIWEMSKSIKELMDRLYQMILEKDTISLRAYQIKMADYYKKKGLEKAVIICHTSVETTKLIAAILNIEFKHWVNETFSIMYRHLKNSNAFESYNILDDGAMVADILLGQYYREKNAQFEAVVSRVEVQRLLEMYINNS